MLKMGMRVLLALGVRFFALADRAWTWTQYVAMAMCSIAVAALALAAFLPAVVGCCPWVKSLAIAGGMFMVGYVLFQLAAVVLAYVYVEASENYCESTTNVSTFRGKCAVGCFWPLSIRKTVSAAIASDAN